MRPHDRTSRGALAVGLVIFTLVWTGAGLAQSPQWPPQFPREGATKLFENDRVIVWEQVWPRNVHMHKHVRDIMTIALESGGIRVLTPDGKETSAGQLNQGKPGWVGYYKAGLGPHAELATDPSKPPRAIFIELKGTEPADCKTWSLSC